MNLRKTVKRAERTAKKLTLMRVRNVSIRLTGEFLEVDLVIAGGGAMGRKVVLAMAEEFHLFSHDEPRPTPGLNGGYRLSWAKKTSARYFLDDVNSLKRKLNYYGVPASVKQ